MLAGSSPLARGLQRLLLVGFHGRGIIPARAGFTRTLWGGRHPSSDHPRSRGVYHTVSTTSVLPAGSSPLARGLLVPRLAVCHRRGIIPARAGFTVETQRSAWQHWDHPRSRGVYVPVLDDVDLLTGSSPLARGLLGYYKGAQGTIGIIPARAGFTVGRNRGPCRPPDHPRSRGVYSQRRSKPF